MIMGERVDTLILRDSSCDHFDICTLSLLYINICTTVLYDVLASKKQFVLVLISDVRLLFHFL